MPPPLAPPDPGDPGPDDEFRPPPPANDGFGLPRPVSRAARDAVRVPGLDAEFRAIARGELGRRLALARRVGEIDRGASFVFEGCASMEEFLVRRGFLRLEARLLVDLGRALALEPRLEASIRAGEIAADTAAELARILARPHLIKPAEDWVAKAAGAQKGFRPARTIRREIQQRLEDEAQRAMTSALVLHVTTETMDAFERARTLASRKASKTLTPGETLSVLAGAYVRDNDPLLRPPGARRLPPVDENPEGVRGSRTIPADVQRAVRRRAGDRCEVPGCENRIHLQFAHIRPHAYGGGREAHQLLLLCGTHHALFDMHLLHFRGTVKRPVFVTADGTILRAPPGEEPPPTPQSGGGSDGPPAPDRGSGGASLISEGLSQPYGGSPRRRGARPDGAAPPPRKRRPPGTLRSREPPIDPDG